MTALPTAEADRRAEGVSGEGYDLNYEGAMSDLNSVLDVLIRRINGEASLESAAEWVRLNYPDRAKALSTRPADADKGVDAGLIVLQDLLHSTFAGDPSRPRLSPDEKVALNHLLVTQASAAAALDAAARDGEIYQQQADYEFAKRKAAEAQVAALREALERAANDLRDIGAQSPMPSNSADPKHENYLRGTLISLGQVGHARARQALSAIPTPGRSE
ncbi:hypothetical protein E4M02_10985 [Brevundimonas sp. S30B]|uniref:hypothetical protein n=1 Tax=unclassified Brevundimonas TaxID=2622653 RepID=UPI0010716B0A|nr:MULTISPECIES: hypothetical protein [unclassified Brevundimonas]QBX38638.1 hypothetical protein E4M01_13245 [Brevundimonas sp. MF30-B]TFW01229.1 hypothetical protein E4M02_10985 [Brevundimonas sp. S30B]